MKTGTLDAMSLREARSWATEMNMDLSLLDFISSRASTNVVVALFNFLWPTFLEVRGCVLLPWAYNSDLFEKWWTQLDGDVPAIEATVNHIHLWDIFSDDDNQDDDSIRAIEEIGSTLKATWLKQLEDQFPGRHFVVDVENDEFEYGPTVIVRSM